LFERLQDRDAAPNGRLHQHVHPLFSGGGGDFSAVASNHSLVGRHHGFTGVDRRQDQAAGWLQASHHFHHQIHIWIGHHGGGIGGEQAVAQRDRAGAIEIAHRHLPQLQISHQGVPPLG